MTVTCEHRRTRPCHAVRPDQLRRFLNSGEDVPGQFKGKRSRCGSDVFFSEARNGITPPANCQPLLRAARTWLEHQSPRALSELQPALLGRGLASARRARRPRAWGECAGVPAPRLSRGLHPHEAPHEASGPHTLCRTPSTSAHVCAAHSLAPSLSPRGDAFRVSASLASLFLPSSQDNCHRTSGWRPSVGRSWR